MANTNYTKGSVEAAFRTKYESMIQGTDYQKKLVELARSKSGHKGIILDGSEEDLPEIISTLTKIVDCVSDDSQHHVGIYLIEELKNEPQFSQIGTLYQYLYTNWDTVKDIAVTYKLLTLLTHIDDWWDTIDDWVDYINLGNSEN